MHTNSESLRERGNANQKRKIRVYSRALAIENPFLESRRLKNLRNLWTNSLIEISVN